MFRNIFVGLVLILLMGSCENDEKEVKALFEKKLGVDRSEQIQTYISQGGIMKAKITAPLLLRYQDTSARVELPKTLHVDFYDTLKQVESQLDAQSALYYENRNVVLLRDSIRVYNRKGDTLFCKELFWDQMQGRYYTEKSVSIHSPDLIIYGEGLSAPQDFKSFEIYKVTNSVVRIRE